MVARGRVIGKRIDTAGDAPRYLVDLEVAIFNQRDELCCPAEVTVELQCHLASAEARRAPLAEGSDAFSRIVGVKGGDLVWPFQLELSEKRVVE